MINYLQEPLRLSKVFILLCILKLSITITVRNFCFGEKANKQ